MTMPDTTTQWDDAIRYAKTEADRQRLRKAKADWQRKHPNLYQRMSDNDFNRLISR